ncbi:MAG: chemotaxis-specific protein-glutamate methyltransferase CheB [Pseudomonadota bacterium]
MPPLPSISVLLVEDSAVMRGALTQILEADGDIVVADTAVDGAAALTKMQQKVYNIILLDLEMPVMDGLTALPKMLEIRPDAKIMICSTLTTANGYATLRALNLGAIDYITKPSSFAKLSNRPDFMSEIREKVRQTALPAKAAPALAFPSHPLPSPAFTLRDMPRHFRPDVLAIGASTGGPRSLPTVLPLLRHSRIPIVITQHMPPLFTQVLAEHLSRQCHVRVKEAENGDILTAGTILVAPGGHHITFVRQGPHIVVALNTGPPVQFCRPSVDVMLQSLTAVTDGRLLSVILTGMGTDGLAGCTTLTQAGGYVIAQDQQSAVIWGMPGAVAGKGLCSAVLPLPDIAPFLNDRFPALFATRIPA